MNKLNRLSVAVIVAGALFTQAAHATPVLYCKDGPGIDLVNDGCISGTSRAYLGGGDGVYSNAGGGDSESAVEAAIFGATGVAVDVSLYGKSDSSAQLFNNTGVNQSASQSGSWAILDSLVNIAYITVKAANSFALYDVGGANSGTWSTAGILTNGGNQPNVSHISFWLSTPTKEVPEPGTIALLALGLLSLHRLRSSRTP